MAITLAIASIVLFVIGVSIIVYDVVSTRRRRDRSELTASEPTVRTREA